MKKKKKTLILGIIFSVILSGIFATYMAVFGPFHVNLNANYVERIYFANHYTMEVIKGIVSEDQKDDFLKDLRTLKFHRGLRCRCMGTYTIRIIYKDGNGVSFDGFLFSRINSDGGTRTTFAMQPQDREIVAIYDKYFPST